jgi:hypothetical protein
MLNTVRSVAIANAILYARWLQSRRHGRSKLPDQVASLLEAHLDPAVDPSLAVRAAIGYQLHVLTGLDRAWVERTLPLMFPSDPEACPQRDALWSSYLTPHWPVYFDLFRLLIDQYQRAVASQIPTGSTLAADTNVANHILLMVQHGVISADSADGLVPALFRGAPPTLLQEALSHLGWSVWRGRATPLPLDQADHLQRFWEWCGRAAEEGRMPTEVLGAFGWWFASGQMECHWSLAELERLVRLDIAVDDLHVVFGRLAELVTADPLRVGSATDAIVANELDLEHLYSDELRLVARELIEAGALPEARAYGDSIVSRMRSRGFATFPDG